VAGLVKHMSIHTLSSKKNAFWDVLVCSLAVSTNILMDPAAYIFSR
jgi:hypothetical protein